MTKNNLIAIGIIELFENLLEKKNLKIDCEDEYEELERDFPNNDARIYGTEYWNLEEKITCILNDINPRGMEEEL